MTAMRGLWIGLLVWAIAPAWAQEPVALPEPSPNSEASTTTAPEPAAPADPPAEDVSAEVSPEEDESEDDDAYEIVVWGQSAIRQARASVIRKFEGLGWTAKGRNRDGDVVFRPPEGWMGKATFAQDGSLEFGRSIISYETARANQLGPAPQTGFESADRWPSDGPRDPSQALTTGEQVAYGDSTTPTASVSVSVLPSKERREAVHRRVIAEVQSDLDEYRLIVQETEFQEWLQVLPDRLDALWAEGTPLEGNRPLPSPEVRRRAVLEYWATRPDTREGRTICDTVGTWLDQVVQESPHPVTAAELEAVRTRRPNGPELDLPNLQ